MAAYESEHTIFMRQWMAQHPEQEREQQKGRALWWDKPPQTAEEMKSLAAARVPQKAYYYDAN